MKPGARVFPKVAALAVPLIAMAAAMLLASLRKGGVSAFFFGPFSTSYAFGNMLASAAILAVAASGAALSLKAGAVNLGGDGQFFLGAVVGHSVLMALGGFHPFLASVVAAVAAFSAAAVLGGISSAARAWNGTDELITSFLASQAILPVLDWAVSGPLRDPGTQLIATRAIRGGAAFARILAPSALTSGAFAAIAAIAAVWIFLKRTRTGFSLRMEGLQAEFAEANGLPGRRLRSFAMASGAGIIGIAGLWAVQGMSLRIYQSFSGGRGFTALACALVAGGNPAFVAPAALFFAYLDSGSGSAQAVSGIPAQTASIIQALLLLAVAAASGKREAR